MHYYWDTGRGKQQTASIADVTVEGRSEPGGHGAGGVESPMIEEQKSGTLLRTLAESALVPLSPVMSPISFRLIKKRMRYIRGSATRDLEASYTFEPTEGRPATLTYPDGSTV